MNSLEFAYINITNKCNLKCFYCYNEESNKDCDELKLCNYQKLSKEFKSLGVKRVALTGGEPFINNNWYEIALLFKKKNIEVVFSTNGTLIFNDDILKLKSLNAKLQISLDGDNDLMEYVSKSSHVYDKVLNLSMKLLDNNIPFNLACVVGKHNINQIDKLIEISDKYGIYISFNFYSDSMNENHKSLALDIDEKYYFIEKINLHNKEKNDIKRISIPLPPLMSPDYIYNEYNTGCGLARNVVGIFSNGDVSVCGPATCCSNLIAGNILKEDFTSIWEKSTVFNSLREVKANDLEGICSLCPFKELCLGSCRVTSYINYGKINGPGVLCQQFYERIMEDSSPYHEFPSKVMKYEK